MNLNSPGIIGNTMSRLAGIKNARPRRVIPGAEFIQKLEEGNEDVSGTAQPPPDFSNFQSLISNQPQPDRGGELTSQSYDVRANAVNPTSQDQPEGNGYGENLRKIGANLWNSLKESWTPGISDETRQQMGIGSQEKSPYVEKEQPLRAQPPEQSPGFWGALADYVNPTKRNQMSEYNQELSQDAQLLSQGKNPNQVRLESQEQQNLTHEQDKAIQEPWQYAAYGSAEQVANSPALSAEFKKITGIDYEPEIAQQVSDYESAMQDVEDIHNGLNTELSGQAEQINQRILNNQTTDADKYYIGLALLMPLIIGGVFGKEAGLGALSGGAKGIADVLGGRQKSIREDEASLLDINKQQASNAEKLANIQTEKAKLGPSLRKALPEYQNAHLLGMREGVWTDSDTGEEMRGVEIKPGLIARPEFLATKEGKADMLKAANELSEVKTYVDEVNDLTEDVVNIVSQLEDPSFAWKGLTNILSGKSPTILSKMTQDVMLDGRKVNAGVALEEKLGFLANAYGMAKDIGQLDRAAQNHIKKIVENPTSTFLTPEDSLNQVLQVRKLAQKGLVRGAVNKGFYPEFVIKDMEQSNNPLFQKLNQSEDQKYNEQLKRKAFQGEMNYAE